MFTLLYRQIKEDNDRQMAEGSDIRATSSAVNQIRKAARIKK